MAIYAPIVSANEQVEGILFVAFAMDTINSLIQESMKSVKIGENGSIAVLDKNYNRFILGHNQKENNFSFYQKLSESGLVDFKENGEEYRSYFAYNQPLGIYILAEAKMEDFTKTNKTMEQIVIGFIVLLLLVVALSSWLMVKYGIIAKLDVAF